MKEEFMNHQTFRNVQPEASNCGHCSCNTINIDPTKIFHFYDIVGALKQFGEVTDFIFKSIVDGFSVEYNDWSNERKFVVEFTFVNGKVDIAVHHSPDVIGAYRTVCEIDSVVNCVTQVLSNIFIGWIFQEITSLGFTERSISNFHSIYYSRREVYAEPGARDTPWGVAPSVCYLPSNNGRQSHWVFYSGTSERAVRGSYCVVLEGARKFVENKIE